MLIISIALKVTRYPDYEFNKVALQNKNWPILSEISLGLKNIFTFEGIKHFFMSILVNKDSRVIVQGFTGSEGTFHATQHD